MSFEPIEDTNLEDLVKEASGELLLERRHAATTLIKNFLMKVEGLTSEIKNLKNQLSKKEESLAKTLEKIKRLKAGDWSLLAENNSSSRPDSEHSE